MSKEKRAKAKRIAEIQRQIERLEKRVAEAKPNTLNFEFFSKHLSDQRSQLRRELGTN